MEISIKCERDGYRRMDIESQMVAITDIVPDDTPREMACIAVDSPDKTFLVDDFIRTHNSAYAKTLLGRLALQGTQLFIIDPANNAGGEYTNLATSLDGTIIDFGGKDGIYLNPFKQHPEYMAQGQRDRQQAGIEYLQGEEGVPQQPHRYHGGSVHGGVGCGVRVRRR